MKSFRQILGEVSQPKSAEERAFKDMHSYETIPHPVALDHQFTGAIGADDLPREKAKRLADQEGDANYDTSYDDAFEYEGPSFAEQVAKNLTDRLSEGSAMAKSAALSKASETSKSGKAKVSLKKAPWDKNEEVDLDEAPRRKGAPKIKPDFLKVQRAKDAEHNAAMGRTKTGRKKPVRTMTSTQKSLASMRREAVEPLDEVSNAVKDTLGGIDLAIRDWEKRWKNKSAGNPNDMKAPQKIKDLKAQKAAIMKKHGMKEEVEEAVELDERDYKKEYANYHGKKEQIANRASRNQARRIMAKENDVSGMDVGHADNNPLNNDPKNLRIEDPSENRREPRLRKEAVELDEMTSAQKAKFDKLYKKMLNGPEHKKIMSKADNKIKGDDQFHGLVKKMAMEEVSEASRNLKLINRIKKSGVVKSGSMSKDDAVEVNPKKKTKRGDEAAEMTGESTMWTVYERILEKRAERYRNAAKADDLKDNDTLPGKGAKDMDKDMAVDKTTAGDMEDESHDSVSKAGRAGPKAKSRDNDNKAGDKKVVNPVKGKI